MSKTSFFILCFVSLVVAGFVYLFLEIEKIKTNQVTFQASSVTANIETSDNSTQMGTKVVPINIDKNQITKIVEETVTNIMATQSSVVKPAATPQTTSSGTKVTYIPISQSGATTLTDWQDVTGSDFYLALVDYGSPKSITFEANLKSANGSGPAYARLYNVTSGVAVSGSEVSTSNTSYTLKSSGNLNLWSGNNLYRVQVKSHDSQEASFGNGKIKILY
jgi:hypothetical protein